MPWFATITMAFNSRPVKMRMKPGARRLSSAKASSNAKDATSAQKPTSPVSGRNWSTMPAIASDHHPSGIDGK